MMLALSGALYLARHRSPQIVPMCCSPFGIVFKTNRCFVRRPFLPRSERLLLAVCSLSLDRTAGGGDRSLLDEFLLRVHSSASMDERTKPSAERWVFHWVRQAWRVARKRNQLGCGGHAGDLEVKVLYTPGKGKC